VVTQPAALIISPLLSKLPAIKEIYSSVCYIAVAFEVALLFALFAKL
jgi:hypothetical protein